MQVSNVSTNKLINLFVVSSSLNVVVVGLFGVDVDVDVVDVTVTVTVTVAVDFEAEWDK
jgi:hypothetical protein